jgi:hypothetical protein
MTETNVRGSGGQGEACEDETDGVRSGLPRLQQTSGGVMDKVRHVNPQQMV